MAVCIYRKHEGTPGVFQIGIHNLRILCQSVAGSAGRLEGFVITAESQVIDKTAAVALTVEKGGQTAEEYAKIQNNARLCPCSHDNGSGNSGSALDMVP